MSLENIKAKLAKEALKACSSASSEKWRKQAQQTQLVYQISNTLLQRRNWPPLLHSLDLSSSNLLTPPLLNQILLRTESHPKLSLAFFDWVKSDLNLQPDVTAHCHLVRTLLNSDVHHHAKRILTSLRDLESDPIRVVDIFIKSCVGKDCVREVLSFVSRWYSTEGLCEEALLIFGAIRVYGCWPDMYACNDLLTALVRRDEIRSAWCLYGTMLRHGVSLDKQTWTAIAHILGKDGSFEKLRRLLNLGVCNNVIFNLVIDGLSEKGDLMAAVKMFDEMYYKKILPGFSSYVSVLDAACKHKNEETVEAVMSSMVKRRLLSNTLMLEYNEVIQKVADLGKSYAAEMLFLQALGKKIHLQDATYVCLLRALSDNARVKDAMDVYEKIVENGVSVNESTYFAFANALCKGSPNEVVTDLLRSMIAKGIRPKASVLSTFIKELCLKGRWREAEDLLEMVMDKNSMPELDCCSSLIEHYCRTKRIDAAIALQHRIQKLNGNLELSSYNLLLDALFECGKGDEASNLFDYMRTRNVVNCDSFVVVIRWLCSRKEQRNAMKYHDEMLKTGFKPDQKRYKQLISGLGDVSWFKQDEIYLYKMITKRELLNHLRNFFTISF